MANKRYKILDGALDYLAYGSDATDVTLPTGTPLRKFQEWRNNERQVTYDTTDWGKPGELRDVIVHAFRSPYGANTGLFVPISGRVQDTATMNPLLTAANIDAGDTNPGQRVRSFVPAKCTVSVPNATRNEPNATSQLTGIKYFKQGTDSYTFPYGQSSSENYEEVVRAGIRGAVPDTANYTLTFSSEKF